MPTPDAAIAELHKGRPADSLEDATLDFKQEAATVRETIQLLADTVVCLAVSAAGPVTISGQSPWAIV